MSDLRCPGQVLRNWKPEDIFEVRCPGCGAQTEIWKDEPVRPCEGCGQEIRNPRIDLGCAKWCKFAEDCVGIEVPPRANRDAKGD